MKQHYFAFMQRLLDKGHAELAPTMEPSLTPLRLYLSNFAVYHPLKPGKIRVVFDSAAETDGVSLNKMLFSGPDLTNNLLGILIRFRQDTIAFMQTLNKCSTPSSSRRNTETSCCSSGTKATIQMGGFMSLETRSPLQ